MSKSNLSSNDLNEEVLRSKISRRKTLALMAGAALMPRFLAGCAGSGTPGSAFVLSNIKAKTTLPPGYHIAPANLLGETAFSSGRLDSNGTFTAAARAGRPTVAWLRDSGTGKHLLFGFVGGGDSTISAVSSAVVILVLAFGIGALAPDKATELLNRIQASPVTTTLASTLSARLSADPYALTDGDPQVQAAVQAAVAALKTAKWSVPTPQAGAGDPNLLVQPGEQFGANIVQTNQAATLAPVNMLRRPISVWTYLVSYETTGSQVQQVSPIQAVGSPQDLPMTTGIIGSLASGNPVYGPVQGLPQVLTMPANAKKANFVNVALMASSGLSAAPAFFSDPIYAAEVPKWQGKRAALNRQAFIGGLNLDLFGSAVGGALGALSINACYTICSQIEAIGAAAAEAVVKVEADKFLEGTYTWLQAAVSSGDIGIATRKAIANIVLRAEGASDAAISSQLLLAIEGIATLLAGCLLVAGAVVGLADLSFTFKDIFASPLGALWTDTLLKPTLSITPASGFIQKGGSTDITATIQNLSRFKFEWKIVSGGHGVLGDLSTTNNVGTDIVTQGNMVNLQTSGSDPDNTVYTIQCQAIDKATGMVISTSTTTVSFTNKITVPGTRIDYDDPHDIFIAVKFNPPPHTDVFELVGKGGTPWTQWGPHRLTYDNVFTSPDSVTPEGQVHLKNTLLVAGSSGPFGDYAGTAQFFADGLKDWTWQVICSSSTG